MKKWPTLLFSLLLVSLCTLPAASQRTVYRSFSAETSGPGFPQLNSDSSYSEYQWGLLNTGVFQLIRTSKLFPVDNSFLGTLVDGKKTAKIPDGPGHYDRITTDAVANIDINIQPAWDLYDAAAGQRDLTVAVIDTGIDYNHGNLKNSMWINSDETGGDGIDNDGNGFIDDIYGWNFFSDSPQVYEGDEDNHGTHAAGTIAASRNGFGISGIADSSHVKIMSLKALGTARGTGTTTNVVKAIRYAEENGAVICNLSFGTIGYSEDLYQAIKNSNMLFVVAAGNGDALGSGFNIDDWPIYPAAFDLDNVISVANLMFDGHLAKTSNFGSLSVDIAAPGSYILSTTPNEGYSYMSGTSMAAPMVTGIAAMLYSYHTDWSTPMVREAILKTAHRLDGLDGLTATGGMVDAYAAMLYSPAP